jgi:UDP-N-acetylglucosamine 2-epimerase
MSRAFFSEFNLPDPVANLNVGSGSHVRQISQTMIRLEKELVRTKFKYVLVPGDTNSALAAGLTANKVGLPVAHIEAGARSQELSMPEEINRRLIDHFSTLLFAPTATCVKNLSCEGISRERISHSGDTMYDLFRTYRARIMQNDIVERQGLSSTRYALVTVHRQGNVESKEVLSNIVNAILRLNEIRFIIPVHPRTQAKLEQFNLSRKLRAAAHVRLINPIGYFDTIKLAASAKVVITDSGGLQKEAFWVGTPCVTVRDRTEWVETIQRKANTLVGTDENRMVTTIRKSLSKPMKIRINPNPFGDGRASQRVVDKLISSLE